MKKNAATERKEPQPNNKRKTATKSDGPPKQRPKKPNGKPQTDEVTGSEKTHEQECVNLNDQDCVTLSNVQEGNTLTNANSNDVQEYIVQFDDGEVEIQPSNFTVQ